MAQFAQRLRLDLANALAGHVELLADHVLKKSELDKAMDVLDAALKAYPGRVA